MNSAIRILERQEIANRTLQEKIAEFKESIKPIIHELTLLHMFATIIFNKTTGEITYKYPNDIDDIRSKYYELIEEIRSNIFSKLDD